MGKMIRKLICYLVGCNYICLHWHFWQHDLTVGSTTSGWQCIRCGDRRFEQWDG